MNDIQQIQLLPAREADYPVVQRLSGYYIYDFSEFTGWPCPESGQFAGCDALFAEWQAGKNNPFIIRVGGELAGFAAVGLDVATREFYIQEFFILRKYRRRGVGKSVAFQLFDQFAGLWRVELLLENSPARRFWQPVITQYVAGNPVHMEEHDSPWGRMQLLRFTRAVPADFPFTEMPRLGDGTLELHLERTIPSDPLRGWLPTYDFAMHVDGRFAGGINLRVGNTFRIVMYDGHIGYGVVPAFRGHHYAERASRLLLPLAKAHGIMTVWITANPTNIASRRTCERLGARLIEIVPLPKDSEQYSGSDRAKCRYRIDLE